MEIPFASSDAPFEFTRVGTDPGLPLYNDEEIDVFPAAWAARARRAIRSNCRFASVPRSLVVTADDVARGPVGAALAENAREAPPDIALFTAYLAYERSRGSASALSAFFAKITGNPRGILELDGPALTHLRSADAALCRHVQEAAETIREYFAFVADTIRSISNGFDLSRDEYETLFATAMYHSVILDVDDEIQRCFVVDIGSFRVSSSPNVLLFYDEDDCELVLDTIRDVEEGDELTIFPGNPSNAELFLSRTTVCQSNPSDTISLEFDLAYNAAEVAERLLACSYIDSLRKLPLSVTIRKKDPRIPHSLLSLCRIGTLPVEAFKEIDFARWDEFRVFDQESEEEALLHLKSLIESEIKKRNEAIWHLSQQFSHRSSHDDRRLSHYDESDESDLDRSADHENNDDRDGDICRRTEGNEDRGEEEQGTSLFPESSTHDEDFVREEKCVESSENEAKKERMNKEQQEKPIASQISPEREGEADPDHARDRESESLVDDAETTEIGTISKGLLSDRCISACISLVKSHLEILDRTLQDVARELTHVQQ